MNIRLVVFVILCVILGGLYINSTAWFRMKLADHYTAESQYAKTIKLYDKVLRKNKVKGRLGAASLARANYERGHLAGKLGLRDLAIESYAAGSAKYQGVDLDRYRDGKDLSKDRLLIIGLLEAGRFDTAIKEFQKLKNAYPDFEDAGKYMAAAGELEKQDTARNGKNFLFSIGDAYIKNRLFDEARAFYTKRILDYGIEPLAVLSYLQIRYSKSEDVKHKVWGNNIFVTLEDFETLDPRLGRWLGGAHAKINNHFIVKDVAYKGTRSELLDITYTIKEYDFWAKNMHIPLSDKELNLGLRLYIKSDTPSAQYLGLESVYPRQSATGVPAPYEKRDAGNGWEEFRIENLSGAAKSAASAAGRNWNTKEMYMGKVVLLNNNGISNKSYIDSIELYLVS